jgi:hypothetical protein
MWCSGAGPEIRDERKTLNLRDPYRPYRFGELRGLRLAGSFRVSRGDLKLTITTFSGSFPFRLS